MNEREINQKWDNFIDWLTGFDEWAVRNQKEFLEKHAPKYPNAFISEQEQEVCEHV